MDRGDGRRVIGGNLLRFLAALAILSGLAASNSGCTSGAATKVRCRVFEVSPEAADAIVSPESRTEVNQSAYDVSLLSTAKLDELAGRVDDRPGLLVDQLRTIPGSRSVADTWGQTVLDDSLSGSSSGGGFIGARKKNGAYDATIDYKVLHTISTASPVNARISYRGTIPDGEAVVFLAPFQRESGQELTHVVAFEFDDPN